MSPEVVDVVQIEAFGEEERVLCADEACIGLLAPDGRCKVCGRAGDDLSTAPAAAPEVPPAAEETAAPEVPPAVDDDFAARRLCQDGACIGLLGEDDRCKVCGRRS